MRIAVLFESFYPSDNNDAGAQFVTRIAREAFGRKVISCTDGLLKRWRWAELIPGLSSCRSAPFVRFGSAGQRQPEPHPCVGLYLRV